MNHLFDSAGLPPVPAPGVTTVSRRAFTFAGPGGDFASTRPGGFFADDVRYLSRLELRIDGTVPVPVDAVSTEPGVAVFCLRVPGHDDPGDGAPGILLLRTREQTGILLERITIENRTRGHLEIEVEIEVGADFAEMLDLLLQGEPSNMAVTDEETDGDLHFVAVDDPAQRRTVVSVSGAGVRRDGSRFIATLRLEPGEASEFVVKVQPYAHGRRVVEDVAPLGMGTSEPRLRSSIPGLETLWLRSLRDLRTLEHELLGHRVVAAGIPWFVTLFGRDSLITGLESLMTDPERALGTATVLAALQGKVVDPRLGEEPGKILHEVRHSDPTAGAAGAKCYYETVDATPLFCILVHELYRRGVAQDRVAALYDSVKGAADWIVRRCERDGLLFYERGETRLAHHGWKDSSAPVVDVRGQPLQGSIAVVEAQGYAVAALRAAASLDGAFGGGRMAESLRERADELQRVVDAQFWSEDLGTMVMALDADGRRADVPSSNPGHLLWAGAVSKDRAEPVVRSLLSDELWTGWGIRTLGRSNPAYNPMAYHRGAVWPHDTAMAAAGMFRYGFEEEALRVLAALLAAAPQFGYQLPELFCGFDREEISRPVRYPTSSAPQAWAAGVPIMLVQQLLGLEPELHLGRIRVAPRLPEDHYLEVTGLPVPGGAVSLRVSGRSVVDVDGPGDIEVICG